MTKDEALDLALEALENLFGIPDKWTGEGGGDVAVWQLGGSHRAQQAITAIKQARALDKKAENAKELGLDYEPDWKEEYQEAVDLHCKTLDELREANAWIRNLEKLMADQDAMLERQTARIVELQEHIENFDGEDR